MKLNGKMYFICRMVCQDLRMLIEQYINFYKDELVNRKPSFFLSQKLNEKVDKIDTYEGVQQLDIEHGWVLYSIDPFGWPKTYPTGKVVYTKRYVYKRLGCMNTSNFQIKPLKSMFTGIPGPYKIY